MRFEGKAKLKEKRKICFRNLLILITPFMIMVLVNESARSTKTGKPYSLLGITAMNSAERSTSICNWACHNDTKFCQDHHATFMKPYFKQTDPLYYGAIGLLMKTGAYGPANILVFVVLFPLMIWLFITQGLKINRKIKTLKQQS